MCSTLARNLKKQRNQNTTWSTIAGTISTSSMAQVQFSLPEFDEKKVIRYNVHLTDTLKNYDLIIGQDLLRELGIDINFSSKTCVWDEHVIPMKSPTSLETNSFAIEESGPAKKQLKD